jgi:hypothetical protein
MSILCNCRIRELLILARTWFAFGLPSKTGCDSRDVIWFEKYPSGSGFEDGEHWFGWNFRISGLFSDKDTNTDILFGYRIRIQYV